MTISNRNVTIKSIFATNANTTIPNPPVAGASYRNESVTTQEIAAGWPYKEIVDSAKFNEAMYEYTTICKLLEEYGFLPWSANTDYPAGGCALGTDGKVYQAKIATGPNTTAVDPTIDTSHNTWDLFYYSDFTANRAIISNGSGKLTTSAVTSTELGYVHGVTSAIQTQLNAKASDSSVVKLTGNQTVGGTKTFTSDPFIKNAAAHLYLDDTNQTKGTAPSADVWSSITFHDANGNLMGRCRQLYTPGKKNSVSFQVHKANSSSDSDSATMGIVYPASGSAYGFAPESDADGSILTTVEEGTANGGWYAKLGNGWMIQQGVISGINSDTETTVTFPKSFKSSTSYTIVKNYQSNKTTQAADREVSFYSLTSTTAKTYTASADTSSFSWVAIGKWK